jgi:deoxyribodipyrimidine photo-lyase
VPELSEVPELYIQEPWRMNAAEQQKYRCVLGVDYPHPIVDHKAAIKKARALLGQYRSSKEFKELNPKVLSKHGSRKGRAQRQRLQRSAQLSLFKDE